MPSASCKLEKRLVIVDASDPVKHIINILEKKIRKLLKKKGKLDVCKNELSEGKELNEDQLKAIGKYDQIVGVLEFSNDLLQVFSSIDRDASKHQKKVAKRERFQKQQEDIRVFKEVLLMQDVLKRMSSKDVRNQFVIGADKSLELSAKDLRNLDEFFKLVSPERGMKEGDAPFQDQLSKASEHLMSLTEGKNKEVLGTTYKYMKELLLKINEFGCFDSLCEIQDREKYNFSDKSVSQTNAETQLEIEVITSENNQVCYNLPESTTFDERTLVMYPSSCLKSKYIQEVLDEEEDLNMFPGSQTDFELTYPRAPTPYQYPAEVYNPQVPTGLSEYDSSQPIPTLTFTNKNYTSVQNMLDPASAIDLNLAMATTSVTNTNIQQDIRYPYVPVKNYETSGGELDGEDSAYSSDIKSQDSESYLQVRGSNFSGRRQEDDSNMIGYHRLNKYNNHYVYRSNFRQDGRQCGVKINRSSRDAQGTRTRYNKINDN